MSLHAVLFSCDHLQWSQLLIFQCGAARLSVIKTPMDRIGAFTAVIGLSQSLPCQESLLYSGWSVPAPHSCSLRQSCCSFLLALIRPLKIHGRANLNHYALNLGRFMLALGACFHAYVTAAPDDEDDRGAQEAHPFDSQGLKLHFGRKNLTPAWNLRARVSSAPSQTKKTLLYEWGRRSLHSSA